MKYKLTMGDRFTIVQLLPSEGELLTMRDVKDMKRNLLPSGDERIAYKMAQDEQGIRWDPNMAALTTEIDFTAPQVGLVVDALRKLKEDKKLKEEHVDLWYMFVEPEDQ